MLRTDIIDLLNNIGRLSTQHLYRLPVSIMMPTSYLDLLFCRDNSPNGLDLKGYHKFGYNSYYGHFELIENKDLIIPKIIFTVTQY